MDLSVFIAVKLFIARARVHAFEKWQELFVIAMVFAISFSAGVCAFSQDLPFVRGKDSLIHAITVDRSQDTPTRQKMHIKNDCVYVKPRATAIALTAPEGASIEAHIKSSRGFIILEGLVAGAGPKILHTVLLSQYKNYPISIPGEKSMQPGVRYPVALTFAATLAGTGDLALHKGDTLSIHADGQLYSYPLPDITIPSEGLLRLYAGTDDTLYYDRALTHPFHSGPCRSKKSK
jgi:hypothetical protein